MQIVEKIYYLGVDDYELDLFEGQYPIPNGISYNSYLIKDEKIAVLDTVDYNFSKKWLDNISEVLGNQSVDYLVIHHMEPDHSASLLNFMDKYPKTIIVGNKKTLQMIIQFFPSLNLENRFLEIKEEDKLNLGRTSLSFYLAPMVHWPEVMMSYEEENKILFSADAFGKFGGFNQEDNWIDEARRYYFGIVGKYGKQVQAILKKVLNLKINYICSLHGRVLANNVKFYIDLYDKWSKYESESTGVLVAYCSMYGNTQKAAKILFDEFISKGIEAEICDLSRTDIFDAVGKAFKYEKLVLASPTYNADIFPSMRNFMQALVHRNLQGKKIGFIENGSWAITAVKKMKEVLEPLDNIIFVEPIVSIKSTIKEENYDEIKRLALALI